jgi:putative endonuclease
MFSLVSFAARKGLAGAPQEESRKQQARETGIRGETYAYWYLRRHGYVLVARNYTAPGIKGEVDLVGYDGPVLAFVEVKARAPADKVSGRPEEAVTADKRRNLSRMAKRFLTERRIPEAACRFDVLAIESRPGARPQVRLHKGAFPGEGDEQEETPTAGFDRRRLTA